jgi:hypothetical protein
MESVSNFVTLTSLTIVCGAIEVNLSAQVPKDFKHYSFLPCLFRIANWHECGYIDRKVEITGDWREPKRS